MNWIYLQSQKSRFLMTIIDEVSKYHSEFTQLFTFSNLVSHVPITVLSLIFIHKKKTIKKLVYFYILIRIKYQECFCRYPVLNRVSDTKHLKRRLTSIRSVIGVKDEKSVSLNELKVGKLR